jgi:hypothetical protein
MLIPTGFLAASGASKPPVTGVTVEAWRGGQPGAGSYNGVSGPGGLFRRDTNVTLLPGISHTITVGAVANASSLVGGALSLVTPAHPSNTRTGNFINGTLTDYGRGADAGYAYGGEPGAGSSGYNGGTDNATYAIGGNGGDGLATAGNIAGTVSYGGGGWASGFAVYGWIYDANTDEFYYGIVGYGAGYPGQTVRYGPNTGNGAAENSGIYAGSGGVVLKLPASFTGFSATTGTFTTTTDGSFKYYFWTTSGSFTI